MNCSFIRFALVLGMHFFFNIANAQHMSADLELIRRHHIRADSQPVLSRPKLPLLRRYNPLRLLAVGALTFYQRVISAQLSANCVFEVSCSRHSRLMISRFGVIKGVALTADRLTRCHRHALEEVPPVRVVRTPGGWKIRDLPEYYSYRELRAFERRYHLR